MIAYASRTGTKRNLDALKARDWRLMLSAKGRLNPLEGEWCWALDNGAWYAFQNGEAFDELAFGGAIELFGEGADFVVAPDIVAGGMRSFDFSAAWLPRLQGLAPIAFAVQDGMTEVDVEPLLAAGLIQVLFVGGSTDWKIATMAGWVALGARYGIPTHIGRVNTIKRIYLCLAAGAHSFDGSGPGKFVECLLAIDASRHQTDLEAHLRAIA